MLDRLIHYSVIWDNYLIRGICNFKFGSYLLIKLSQLYFVYPIDYACSVRVIKVFNILQVMHINCQRKCLVVAVISYFLGPFLLLTRYTNCKYRHLYNGTDFIFHKRKTYNVLKPTESLFSCPLLVIRSEIGIVHNIQNVVLSRMESVQVEGRVQALSVKYLPN